MPVAWLASLTYALSLAATALAWRLVRLRQEHRPVATLLTVGLLADAARRVLLLLALDPARARFDTAPWEGGYRVAGHLGEALYLAWPASLAAASLVVFLRRHPWPVAIAWAASLAALVVTYPVTRGAVLARCYLAAELAAIAVGLGSFLTWARRGEKPTVTHAAALLVVGVELVTLLPYRKGPFVYWPIAQASYLTLYVALIVLQGGVSWDRGSSSESSSR